MNTPRLSLAHYGVRHAWSINAYKTLYTQCTVNGWLLLQCSDRMPSRNLDPHRLFLLGRHGTLPIHGLLDSGAFQVEARAHRRSHRVHLFFSLVGTVDGRVVRAVPLVGDRLEEQHFSLEPTGQAFLVGTFDGHVERAGIVDKGSIGDVGLDLLGDVKVELGHVSQGEQGRGVDESLVRCGGVGSVERFKETSKNSLDCRRRVSACCQLYLNRDVPSKDQATCSTPQLPNAHSKRGFKL